MQQGTGLPAPPAPPKKRRIWPWILGTIITLGVIGQLTQQEAQPTIQPINIPTVDDSGLTDTEQMQVARVVWDEVVSQADKNALCDYYNTPPVGTTPEMVQAFAEGAEMSYADAERILDQLLAEKC